MSEKINWKLGDTSRRYEVGPKGGPATISTGRGDRRRQIVRNLSTFIIPWSSPEIHKRDGIFKRV